MVCTINTSTGTALQWLEKPRGLGVGLSVQLPGSQLHGPLGGLFLCPLGFHFSFPFLSLFPGQLCLHLSWDQDEKKWVSSLSPLVPRLPYPGLSAPRGKHSLLSASKPSQLSSPQESGSSLG